MLKNHKRLIEQKMILPLDLFLYRNPGRFKPTFAVELSSGRKQGA